LVLLKADINYVTILGQKYWHATSRLPKEGLMVAMSAVFSAVIRHNSPMLVDTQAEPDVIPGIR
jgi:hypothetical protein